MPKQDNENYQQYKRRVIDIKSESFCAAKWYNATIWLGSGMTTSCHHPPAHSVDIDKLSANPKLLHNTDQKKQDRAMMQRGERPAGCEYCWKIEDMGRDAVSDRVFKTIIYEDSELDQAFNTPADQDVNLKTLEIAFDRTCQLACSYCNPAFSSTWVRDIKNNGPYQNLRSDGRNHFTHTHESSQLYTFSETNPYIEAFFRWWETDLHKTLQELRITGGEPFMSGHTWQLIEWFKKNPGRSHTKLAINSNLGPNVDVDRFLDSIDGLDVDIYTSNESVGLQAEYIRDGLDWRLWITNMHKIARSGKVRGLHVMNTINALCLDSLPEFLDLLVSFKSEYGQDSPNFTLNILRFPSFQSPLVLPDDIRTYYKDRLAEFLHRMEVHKTLHDFECDHLRRLIDYLDVVKTPHSGAFDLPTLRGDFKKFYTQYDQRRGKRFADTFPYLKEWYESIQI